MTIATNVAIKQFIRPNWSKLLLLQANAFKHMILETIYCSKHYYTIQRN